MIIAAFVSIIVIISLLVFMDCNGNETMTGFVTGIGGMFARNIGSGPDCDIEQQCDHSRGSQYALAR